jgi:uncharacterized glyoxalase superfamily protein PhnB
VGDIERLIPVLVYEDIEAGHDYLVKVFGFESGGVERTPDGTVVHAEVRTRNGPIWLHRETDGLKAPRNLPAQHGGLSVFVNDVDAHFARVKAAGALVEREPEDQPYGLRDCSVRDPEGHHWWFSQELR